MHKKDIAYLIGLEPKEAVKYLESHGVLVPKNWTDVATKTKAIAKKAVEKAKLDMSQKTLDLMKKEKARIDKSISTVIESTKDEIAKAVATGSGERLFKKRMTEVLKKVGMLGEKSRLSLIYRTQVSQAYSAGRWKAIEKAAPLMPYLTYHCSMLPTSRDPHKRLNGMTYHINDPIWNTIYPPNGFHCKCWVTQHSARDIENRGIHIHQSADTPWASKVPDSGWAKNPAKNPEDVYQIDYGQYNTDLAEKQIKSSYTQFLNNYKKDVATVVNVAPVGFLGKKTLDFLKRKRRTPTSTTIIITKKKVTHLQRDVKVKKNNALTKEQVENLPDIIMHPDNIYFDNEKENLLFVINESDEATKVIVEIDYKLKKQKIGNMVVSGGQVKQHNLKEAKYEKVE